MIHNDRLWYKMLYNITKIRKIMIRYINTYRILYQSRFWWSKILNTSKVAKWRRNHEISIWPHESKYFFTGISKIAVPIRKTSTKPRKINDFKMSFFFVEVVLVFADFSILYHKVSNFELNPGVRIQILQVRRFTQYL